MTTFDTIIGAAQPCQLVPRSCAWGAWGALDDEDPS
jgi:hypothetical protein